MITVCQCVYDLTRAGAQQTVHHLVRLRDRDRVNMVVYALQPGALTEELSSAGVTVRVLSPHLPFVDPALVIRLGRRLREDRVDVLHTHLFGADLHGGLAARFLARIPAVTTIHSERFDNRRQALAAGALLRVFSRVVAVGKRVEESLTGSFPYLSSRIQMIPNGVEDPGDLHRLRADSRHRLQIPDSALAIGTVGRLAPEKAHADLLQAFRRVFQEEPRARLIILGEGPLRPELEGIRARDGLEGVVSLPGSLPGAEALLPGFDLFVLPSLREGLPMALLEAMMAGLPCVASEVGSVGEAIRDGRNGRLVPAGRPGHLARVILDLLRDPQGAARMGAAAREDVQRQYGAGRMVAAYEALYSDLARQGREEAQPLPPVTSR